MKVIYDPYFRVYRALVGEDHFTDINGQWSWSKLVDLGVTLKLCGLRLLQDGTVTSV